jgi:hypothetical protein
MRLPPEPVLNTSRPSAAYPSKRCAFIVVIHEAPFIARKFLRAERSLLPGTAERWAELAELFGTMKRHRGRGD